VYAADCQSQLLEPISDKFSLSFFLHMYVRASFGNITPTSDVGRFAWAMYVVVICNIFAGLLDHGRLYLESFCHEKSQSEKKVKELLKNNKEILVKKEE